MASGIPRKSATVTPDDTNYLKAYGTLYVGTEGDICVLLVDDADSNDASDGTIYKAIQGDFPRVVKKVFSTNTDATDIVVDVQSGS